MKTFLLAGVVMLGLLPSARAYSLEGPIGNNPKPNPAAALGDSWQTPVIGYGLAGDLSAPKNLGEEYRRNTPVMYYAFDASFLGFFGSNGVVAVDQTFTILNNAFTNNPTGITNGLDGYSASLSEFPLESRHFNYQAQALGLYDLKSATLGVMMEQVGLADPVRYTWTLHDRVHVGPAPCPVDMQYLVVQRNFDIVSSPLNQLQYSPYVNNTLYSYQIFEFCTGIPTALAVPYSVDPLADTYSPVASSTGGIIAENTSLGVLLGFAPGLYSYGSFYTGLTRDDVAGLRYLLQAENKNWETVSADSLVYTITTNFDLNAAQPFPPVGAVTTNAVGFYYFNGNTNGGFGYGSLAPFLAFAQSNGPAALQAAYPGVAIASYTTTWAWASNATYSYSYNAPYGSPYGSPPILTVTTNYTGFWQPSYTYQFANVFTNHYYTNKAYLVSTTVGPPIGSPYGSAAITNTTVVLTNQIGGDFFVLSPFYTNVCPLDVIDSSHFNPLVTTNYLTVANTNLATPSNSISFSSSVYLVTTFTNYSYLVSPVTCAQTAAATGLYQGIEKMQFVKGSYDSLLGQFFQPITNNYSMVTVVNSQAQVQNLQRIVTVPDFKFDAADLTDSWYQRSLTFDQANVLLGQAGPGTITTPTLITFNKVGPVFYNGTAGFNDVMDGTPYFRETPGGDVLDTFYSAYFLWASFDGSTNAPVVYPNGTSIDNLQNQVLIKVSPSSLPVGFNGLPYTMAATYTKFTATGGAFTQPYTWSATGLPAGMSVLPDGTLSGTPTQSGTFVFTLILTDYLSRSVQWQYTLTIQ